jgi:hypothetical protein
MANSLPTGLSAKRLDKRDAVLGRLFPRRWFWFGLHRKTARAGRGLALGKPAAVERYDAATARIRKSLARQRRQVRWQITVLRFRIVVSSVWGFLKRYWLVFLVLLLLAAFAAAIYVFREDILALAERLSQPSAQSTTTPPQPSPGQSP